MPGPSRYLAFDLGASTSRAILGTLVDGVLKMEELHRFVTPILESRDHLYWDLGTIWSEMQTGLDMALSVAPELRSLSVDSWAVDYVRLDSAGKPLGNPYCYRDPRTDGVMERALVIMPAHEIYQITGIQFLPFNTLFQVLADEAVDSRAGGHRVSMHLTIADYFNYRFSGRQVMERSMASTTQMMDIHTGRWSSRLFHRFGLNSVQWPEILPSGSWLAPVSRAPDVSAVASCSHDTGCAVAATPAASPNERWAFISCGTWSLLGQERAAPILSAEAQQAGFTNEAGLDGTIRFLKNLTGLWVLQECMREWSREGSYTWSDLERDARQALMTRSVSQTGAARERPGDGQAGAPDSPLSPSPNLIDLEDQRFLARGDMEGRVHAYCSEHGLRRLSSRGEIAVAVLSSIADSYRRALVALSRITGSRFERIHLFGGGSRNELLCQLTADACRMEVVAGPAEATAMGNLLIQARTMGDLPEGRSIRDIATASSDLNVYSPQKD